MRREAGIIPNQCMIARGDREAEITLIHRLLGAGNKFLKLQLRPPCGTKRKETVERAERQIDSTRRQGT